MNIDTNTNYLTNSLAKAQEFAKQAVNRLEEGINRTPWGSYKSELGSIKETISEQARNIKEAGFVRKEQGVYPSGRYSSVAGGGSKDPYNTPNPVKTAASVAADVLTDKTQRDLWHYTNLHRMVRDAGNYVAPRLGLESTLAGAAVAAAVPVSVAMLSGQMGPISEGLRPKGYKAVAPVSKEEDPSGRKTRSVALELAMRRGLGQKSQLLGYQDFRQERPDIAPSTYAQYRRYSGMKPDPGKNVVYDPESQSFSALGGIVRGTARGLNDPEIRVKNVPITASAILGTAAGLGAIKALTHATQPKLKIETTAPDAQGTYDLGQGQYPGFAKVSSQQHLGVKVAEKLGGYTEPAILLAGAATTAAVGHVAKKLFQKSAERKVKKENPVEYLKYKHGSLEQASQALGAPGARNWQQLAPLVNNV
jgi:hypothetical protein